MPGALRSHTRIYLTGFMGSGKSAAGPLVARALGLRFVDLDRRIERAAGVPIADLFASRGEAAFRDLERAAVRRVSAEEGVVVALGGGAVADPELRALLLATGLLVWLRASPETVARRVAAVDRPLLRDPAGRPLEGPALLERIRTLMDERAGAYGSAHVAVDADSPSIRETAERIVRLVRARSDDRRG